MKGITGLATGIGSLPYKDADEAVDLIFRSCPQIPFWPQLPKKDLREGMVIQFMENLPCIQLDALVYTRGEKKLEECYKNIINNNKDYFKITPDYAVGLYAFKDRLKREIGLLKNIKFI